ncbi:MAG TPA: hypothetical protein VN612_15920 [Acidobacteriaceae bacterium]|nr:hypothetical protein [Acidobacteriaceae bacterium]
MAEALALMLIRDIPPPLTMPEKNSEWTKNVRRKLRSPLAGGEFIELDWKCFPADPESSKGEFLVDFLWWRAREGAVLVVESEWSPNMSEVLTDFDKLAVIKAPFKLMIYSTYPRGPSSEDLKREFEDHLSNYRQHIEGETYIFIEFLPHERAQALVWQADANGEIRNVVLSSLVPEQHITRPN